MSSSSDDRLESAFSAALNCPSALERQEWLARLSNADPALAREVASLLATHTLWGEQLEVPANIAYSLLLTTLHDGRRVTESDLAALLAQVGFRESPDDLGRLGSYTLQECVAVGNTGFVFRAWDPQLDRPVAIKVLAPSIAEDAARCREFLNEARMASRIRHENVVTIFHVSADDATGLVFFVMEWVSGATLQSWLEQHPQPGHDDVLRIVEQIVHGLTTIHAAGIVHRDLKPGNILRDESTGQIVIVDFGLAFEGHTEADLLAGTPMYMSPEQLCGQSVTARSDLFSFGAITFQLVYQRHPFSGQTLSEVTTRILQGVLEFPVSDDPRDSALQPVLRKCLAAEPEKRFATAEEFWQEFRDTWSVARALPETNKSDGDVVPHTEQDEATAPPLWRRLEFWALLTLSGVLFAWAGHWLSRPPAPGFEDRDTYVNSQGMRFRRIPKPPPIAAWPPFPEHRELTDRIDWRNIDRDFFLSESEVTRREFAAVMGVSSSATTAAADQGLPMTGITFDEAETFCRKLTERDRDGWIYHVPWEIEMTYAAYGFDLLSRGATPATLLEPPPLTQDTIVAARQSNRSALGLLGMSGNVWEWTDATLRKPPQGEGVVSFAATGEIPAEESRFVFGGGARDLFVHAYDMNCGINDFLERAENAHTHTEPDGATKYLCPKSHDQPLRLIYHYTFASPVRSAKLVALLGLHVEQSEFEVRVRKAVRQDSESHVEDWRSVVKHRGLFSARPAEIDLTEPLAGAVEAWLEFRLQADEPPRHYTQFARTSHVLKLPDVVRFEAELEPSPTGPRNQVAVPRSHRSPFIGLRVAMRPARR